MNKINWMKLFRPKTYFMMEEIEYLKAQVSYAQRRYDNLIEQLTKEPVKPERKSSLDQKQIKKKLYGWSDLRDDIINNPDDYEPLEIKDYDKIYGTKEISNGIHE